VIEELDDAGPPDGHDDPSELEDSPFQPSEAFEAVGSTNGGGAVSADPFHTEEKRADRVVRLDDVRDIPFLGDDPSLSESDSSHEAEAAGGFEERVRSRRVDLLHRIREGIPPIEFVEGSSGRYVRGRRHYVPAPKKTGKSFLAAIDAVDVTLSGGRVVIFDRENGADLYASRLDAILVSRTCTEMDRDAMSARLDYYEFPLLRIYDDRDLVKLCVDADLVIFDSQRMFLSDLKLDENSSDDYAAFMAAAVDPLFRAGIATVILDNTGHSEPRRGRGSSGKGDLNEILFTLETVEPFDTETTGKLRLEVADSRLGTNGRWEIEIGGGVFGIWERVDTPDGGETSFRPTALMERASVFLENSSSPVVRREITDAIGGKARFARTAVDVLVREGYARGDKGHGVESIKRYRESEDPLLATGRNG
jgi:AAA domain